MRKAVASSEVIEHIPDNGMNVGSVNTAYNAKGELVRQSVRMVNPSARKLKPLDNAFIEALKNFDRPIRGIGRIPQAPKRCDSKLLASYPMGDPHLGMYSWAAETGDDFNLDIAEANLFKAVDILVARAPAAEHALITNLGDFFHADNEANQTARSGNPLDVDTRYVKVLGVGIDVMKRIVHRALQKHKHVTLHNVRGNHDDHSSIALAYALREYFDGNERVHIPIEPSKFNYYEFGLNLMGSSHGDAAKAKDFLAIMAHDQAEAWGRTRYRYMQQGHLHHSFVQEYPGLIVEGFRTLAPKDAWHASMGYRSGRDMRCDTHHADLGRVNSSTTPIEEILSLA